VNDEAESVDEVVPLCRASRFFRSKSPRKRNKPSTLHGQKQNRFCPHFSLFSEINNRYFLLLIYFYSYFMKIMRKH